jgi:hypothetical protein
MEHRAALRPFQGEPDLEALDLEAGARWRDGVLELQFRLDGPLDTLVIPGTGPQPQRRDGLWQSTCFEAFLAVPDQPGYWEINLAPCGDWNVYVLTGYREGLKAEQRIVSLPHRQRRTPAPGSTDLKASLELEISLDLTPLLPAGTPLELSATAVMEHQHGRCSYWAWQHSGPEADFHRRDSFQRLSAQPGPQG